LGIDEEDRASWDGQELQARPMGAYVRPNEHAVFFLADARHHKDEDIRKYRKVCLAFSDTGGQNYVSVAGDAEVLNDRSMIRELSWPLARNRNLCAIGTFQTRFLPPRLRIHSNDREKHFQ
jgi:hypothetical protein